MVDGNKSDYYLFIFVHMEKCGGTSLLASSRRRNGLKHCDIISSKKLGNVADASDFARSLAIYPNCDFITGHCLYPDLLEKYKRVALDRGLKPIVITSTRNPVDRLLSDYAHSRRRGELMGLGQFIEISFKKNYICNFWGNGSSEVALKQLNGIDYVVNVKEFDEFVRFVNLQYELKLLRAVHSNPSKIEDFPEDLMVGEGVRIGKYSIDQTVYDKILEYNKDDLELLNKINHWMPESGDASPSMLELDVAKTKQIWAWLYRNLWYKPRMQRSFGRLYEKRNSVPHRLDDDVEYMWRE